MEKTMIRMETSFEEIRQILRELAIAQKETGAELRALFKQTDAKFKETDAKILALSEESKRSERKIKEQGKQIGGIGERFGSFIEGLAYPSMRRVLSEQYSIENTIANIIKDFPDGRQVEFDAFGYTNGTVNNAVVVEVKLHLQSKHIYDFKQELTAFKNDFPEFKDKHLYGVLATARVVPKELKTEIFNNGLHLAIIQDDIFSFNKNPQAVDFNAA